MALRPYQKKIVKQTSDHYLNKINKILMRMETGLGKTRTAAYIVTRYLDSGRQYLWVVHREELLMQAALTFAEAGISHQLICSEKSERAIKAQEFREYGKSFVTKDALLVISSVQTIVRRLDGLPWLNPASITPDECHLSLAATWRKVLTHWENARLLGLTATPDRLDGQSFHVDEGGLYEEMVEGPPMSWAIENGYLSSYRAYAPPVRLNKVALTMKGKDYDPAVLDQELDSFDVYGDVVGHYRTYSDGKPAIVFCPTVHKAEQFAQAFRDAGYRAQSVDGTTDDTVRRNAILQLSRGELDVLTSVDILIEGTDIPYATTAIWLRRTKSLVKYLQGTGRVLRPFYEKGFDLSTTEGRLQAMATGKKPFAIILDCVGIIEEHGLPDDDREWSLRSDPKRKKSSDSGESDVMVVRCPKCQSLIRPVPVCYGTMPDGTACGHVFEIRKEKEFKQVDGELEELTREKIEELRRQRMQAQGQAGTMEDLIAQGMSRQRAEHILQAREQKAQLVASILADAERMRSEKGMGLHQQFGVTASDVRRMKPKELRDIKARIDEILVTNVPFQIGKVFAM